MYVLGYLFPILWEMNVEILLTFGFLKVYLILLWMLECIKKDNEYSIIMKWALQN